MKYLHTREEVIAALKVMAETDASALLRRAIEMLEAIEDKKRDHHFKKVA